MNECDHASLVGAYHDGELPPASAVELEAHIQRCPECAAELVRLCSLSRVLGSASWPQMPPEALGRLHRKVDLVARDGIRKLAEALAGVAASIVVACSVALAVLPGTAGPAQASARWETVAVSQQQAEASAASTEEQIALWIVQELPGNGTHE